MRLVVWDEEALADLEEALAFIAGENPSAALNVERRILAAVELLAAHPIGRPGRLPEISQKLVLKTPHIVAYRASEAELTVLRVVHQRENWPAGFWPEE